MVLFQGEGGIGEGESVGLAVGARDYERAVGGELGGEGGGFGAAFGPEDGIDGELGGGFVAFEREVLMRGPLAAEVRPAHGAGRLFRVEGNGELIGDGGAPREVGGENLGG